MPELKPELKPESITRATTESLTKSPLKLGGRLPLLDPEKLRGPQKTLADLLQTQFVPWAEKAGFKSQDSAGHFIGPFNALLYSPEICESFMQLQLKEQDNTSLTKRVREVVILTVGSVWKSAYELYAHKAVGQHAGLTEEQVHALASGEACESLTRDEQAAQEFTRSVVSGRNVPADLYAKASELFGSRGLVEMLVLIGLYQTVCGVLNAFEVAVPSK